MPFVDNVEGITHTSTHTRCLALLSQNRRRPWFFLSAGGVAIASWDPYPCPPWDDES